MANPYFIRIFLSDGDPDGIRVVEKSNWNGIGLVVPRAMMVAARQRKELSKTGVYILLGPVEEAGLPTLYIGEGDPIGPRLDSHASKKDFWTVFVAFMSQSDNLNKAYVQYLEARLIEIARDAKRCHLDNINVPTKPTLSEADAAAAEGFLSEMLLCFPVIGVTAFTKASAVVPVAREFHLSSSRGVKAVGAEVGEGFAVRAGALAAADSGNACPEHVLHIRAELLSNGVFVTDGALLRLQQDYVFSSPSSAASVLLGRSANGRTEWKTAKGRTLKEVQERSIT